MNMFWIFWFARNFFDYYFVIWRDSFLLISSRFQIAIYHFFPAISHFIYFIFKWRFLRLKHKWTWSKAKCELQIKISGWVRTKWNASIANEFSFYSFCFQTVDTNVKIFCTSIIRSWIWNVCKRIFQKKGRNLNYLAVKFQVNWFSKKSLNLLIWESDDEWMEFSCEIQY